MDLVMPWALGAFAAATLIVIALAFLWPARKSRYASLKAAHTQRLRQLPEFKAALAKRRVLVLSTALIIALTVGSAAFVAARPATKTIESQVKYNRDIVLCLDVSGSMIETDIEIINKFYQMVDEFNGERVSLVVFNSISNQVFPLTDDYAYIIRQLDYVLDGFYINTADQGYDIYKYTIADHGASLISDGLTACTMSFDLNDEERSRSIILATDNVPNGTPVVPLDAAFGLAKSKGIRVYGINPGSVEYETGARLPELEAQMQEEVESTGGKYFPLDQLTNVSEIVGDIAKDASAATNADPIVVQNDDPALVIWILLFLSIPTIIFFRRIS